MNRLRHAIRLVKNTKTKIDQLLRTGLVFIAVINEECGKFIGLMTPSDCARVALRYEIELVESQ